MPLKILYIGGTGEISYACLAASAAAGHQCTVFNRGRDPDPLPAGVSRIVGDLANDSDYARLGEHRFDVVCQFKAYTLDEARRDVRLFSGRCGQFVFISSASAYQKPPAGWRISEETPLRNSFWDYSQTKADMEKLLKEAGAKLPLTIVRPSHTYRRKFPGNIALGDDHVWRMLNGRPVVIHGDGQSLWTLTHASDFAKLFVPLLGHPRALGGTFNVMTDTAFTWQRIFELAAQTYGAKAKFVHVPTATMVRYDPQWIGPLLGDKSWSTLFDTSKVQSISGPVERPMPIEEGFAAARPYVLARLKDFKPDEKLHALIDRMAREQEGLGG